MSQTNGSDILENATLQLATDIITAYVSHNPVPAKGLPEVIKAVHSILEQLARSQEEQPVATAKPAVPIKRSVTRDYLICLEDGKKLKMLKRYLRSRYDMSPEEYRAKWGLPPDYPMVAPSYAEKRSEFAKQIGLGRGGKRGKRTKAAASRTTIGKTTAKATGKSPGRPPAKTPGRPPAKTPAKTSGKAPAKSTGKTTGRKTTAKR